MPHSVASPGPQSASSRFKLPRIDVWAFGTLAVAIAVAMPILWVIGLALTPSGDMWSHLVETVLGRLVFNTVLLMVGVGVGTFVIGTGTAWIVTMCRFPGRRIFEWALLIPMAVPAYVIAYVYTDLLEYSGPIQGMIRDAFGFQTRHDYVFPEIRSLGGAITMMTLVLYPYVYLLARAAFLEQSVCVLEASRTLGKGPWTSFFKVALPLARPSIAVGVSLVMMETLNDFGTVDFFAVATFTAGIFDVWLNMNSPSGAAQLASMLLMFVIVLVGLERYGRRKQKFHHTSTHVRALPGFRLSAPVATLAFMACAIPVTLGFAVPAWVLGSYAMDFYQDTLDADFWTFTGHSLLLSGLAAIMAIVLGVFLAYSLRLGQASWVRGVTRLAALGYAVPGAVLAIGILMYLGWLDNTIDGWTRRTFDVSTGLIFSGTVLAVTFGYVVRFLSLSFGSAEAGLGKITANMDGAARTLGAGPMATLRRVHLPMMQGSIMTAALLVFVDCMKELPMTVILRPFDFETLATFVHQYASDELLPEASLAALTIVGAGIIPVILLSLTIARSRTGQAAQVAEPTLLDLEEAAP
ncbi:iron ABC transporter permease [Magnetovibrio sp.]|uniref:ABC transporter permease n=1 Tax=Magnetovibrio sp. TaxID=2024836 RepID=UPI002F95E22D